jgi:hypothetical protein
MTIVDFGERPPTVETTTTKIGCSFVAVRQIDHPIQSNPLLYYYYYYYYSQREFKKQEAHSSNNDDDGYKQ